VTIAADVITGADLGRAIDRIRKAAHTVEFWRTVRFDTASPAKCCNRIMVARAALSHKKREAPHGFNCVVGWQIRRCARWGETTLELCRSA